VTEREKAHAKGRVERDYPLARCLKKGGRLKLREKALLRGKQGKNDFAAKKERGVDKGS